MKIYGKTEIGKAPERELLCCVVPLASQLHDLAGMSDVRKKLFKKIGGFEFQ